MSTLCASPPHLRLNCNTRPYHLSSQPRQRPADSLFMDRKRTVRVCGQPTAHVLYYTVLTISHGGTKAARCFTVIKNKTPRFTFPFSPWKELKNLCGTGCPYHSESNPSLPQWPPIRPHIAGGRPSPLPPPIRSTFVGVIPGPATPTVTSK